MVGMIIVIATPNITTTSTVTTMDVITMMMEAVTAIRKHMITTKDTSSGIIGITGTVPVTGIAIITHTTITALMDVGTMMSTIMGIITAAEVVPLLGAAFTWTFWLMLSAILLLGCIASAMGCGGME